MKRKPKKKPAKRRKASKPQRTLQEIAAWSAERKLKDTLARKKTLEKRIKQQKAHVKRLQTAIKKNGSKLKRVNKRIPELQKKVEEEKFLEGMKQL